SGTVIAVMAGVAEEVRPPIQAQNVAFTLVTAAIVILLLQFMQSVLIPIVLGGLLFYALDPAVDWLQRIHVPRALGAALVLALVVAGMGGLVYSLQGQAMTVVDQLPTGARKLAASLRQTPRSQRVAIEKVQQAADVLQGADNNDRNEPGVLRVKLEE